MSDLFIIIFMFGWFGSGIAIHACLRDRWHFRRYWLRSFVPAAVIGPFMLIDAALSKRCENLDSLPK